MTQLAKAFDELLRVLAQRPAGLHRLGDRAVVDVGVVAHLRDAMALGLERAAQHVEGDERAEVADVSARVDREAARVHPHVVAHRWGERFFLPREGVVETQD